MSFLDEVEFFFFQAEDGIRDIGVTGVQTCALPISIKNAPVDVCRKEIGKRNNYKDYYCDNVYQVLLQHFHLFKNYLHGKNTKNQPHIHLYQSSFSNFARFEIGRASCRERV